MAIINIVHEGKYGCNKLKEISLWNLYKYSPRKKRDTKAEKNT